jgi:hypothetical protein
VELEKRVSEVAKEITNVVVKAFEVITGLSPISENSLLKHLGDAVMVVVHELAHEAIRSAYRELDTLYERDPVLGECASEVGARMLEVYVLKKIGARAHSFEELALELEGYASLRGVCWSASMLQELYVRAEALLERMELKEFMGVVVRECERVLKEK